MKIVIAALLIASTSVPAIAAAPEPVQTIIADNSGECGIYRLAMHRRDDNIATAEREAARLNRLGIKTRVIVVQPGQFRGTLFEDRTAPVAIFNAC